MRDVNAVYSFLHMTGLKVMYCLCRVPSNSRRSK